LKPQSDFVLLLSSLTDGQFFKENVQIECSFPKVGDSPNSWHPSCYTSYVTRKPKIVAKSSGLAKLGQKRTSGIRLNDLMPKKRITGGKGLLFGASDNSQPPTDQPGDTT